MNNTRGLHLAQLDNTIGQLNCSAQPANRNRANWEIKPDTAESFLITDSKVLTLTLHRRLIACTAKFQTTPETLGCIHER